MKMKSTEKRWSTYQNQVKGMLANSGRGSVAMAAVTGAVLVDVNQEAEATIITGTNFSAADMTLASGWDITGSFQSGATMVSQSKALGAFDGLVQWQMNTTSRSSYTNFGFSGYKGSVMVANPFGLLSSNVTIGSSMSFIKNTPFSSSAAGQSGYIGVRFDLDGTTCYGWIEAAVSEDGNSLSLISWAYDDSGAAIITGAVPEPTAMALLAMGAVGVGVYRRRKKNG